MQERAADAEWLAASLAQASGASEPYPHWLLATALAPRTAAAIAGLPFAPPEIADTLGKRETHNATRIFFAGENLARHRVCAEVAALFQAPAIVRQLQDLTGASLAGTSLRIEYCQDGAGFWLEPHTDIGAKLFTMLVYLSDAADAEDWGTDIYDRALTRVGRVPGGFNKGLIFIPGENTWHGVERRCFAGIRKSIIVNYVKPEWRARHELAFPAEPVRP